MRKTLLGMMLAVTAAVPAMAAAQQWNADAPRDQRGSWRGERGGREGRLERSQLEAQQQARAQAQVQAQAQAGGRGWNRSDDRPAQQQQDWQQRQGTQQRQDWQQRQGWQQQQRTDGRQYGDADRRFDNRGTTRGNQWQDRRATDRGSQWQRGYDNRREDGRNDRFAQQGQWNRGWRSNDRYDYRDYRSGNRGAFRLPRYYAPGGWDGGYRRFSIGIRLNSVLFGQNYWIDDPYDYRLPPAYGPYRWVRYYNDALLVDIRSGYVVDTVYDIFW